MTLPQRLTAFMDEHVYPNEAVFHHQVAEGDRWQPTPIVEALKARARARKPVPPRQGSRGVRQAAGRAGRRS